jgi:hypothetical protein
MEISMVRPAENWINPKIEVRESPIHGQGMFASAKIEQGEELIIWRECYTDKAGALKAVLDGKGTMQWDEDVFSYETELHREHYMINHSCDPNGWMADAHTLEARKDIFEGEEITVDMAMFESDEGAIATWSCNCGSRICRGRITGKDWRLDELQRRYRGHFSPLVNKRIMNIGIKKETNG